jgi:hypothetical protein
MEDGCMKKAVIFFVLAVVVVFSCIAQSANYQQKILGTWTDHKGEIWVFGADGRATVSGGHLCYYGVTDTKLAVCDSYYGNLNADIMIYNISISSDGKTLILNDTIGNPSHMFLLKK